MSLEQNADLAGHERFPRIAVIANRLQRSHAEKLPFPPNP
jgi:hypothetical protein